MSIQMLWASMHKPDVVLTDYLITLICFYFAFALSRRPAMHHDLRRMFVGLYFFTALASFLGGTYHGYFEDGPLLLSQILWRGTIICIGVTSFYIWHVALFLSVPQSWRRWTSMFFQGALIVFALLVAYYRQDFLMAVMAYLPAVLYLTGVMVFRLFKNRDSRMSWGLLAMLLTIGAAIVQVKKIAIHPVYFDHNALYHVIQAVGLYILYRFAQRAVVWS